MKNTEKCSVPRVLTAGTGSGCGKTTIVCSILTALKNRGLNAGSFKCGPDYIDPMFHRRVTGTECSNLDLFFFDENTAKFLLAKRGAARDISVIEGVMGFYDGMGMDDPKASSYDVAKVTDTPAVLIVDARGSALSVLATVHGFLDFYDDNTICGVILNRCTKHSYEALAEAMRKRFQGKVRPLGFMPSVPEAAIESRHLGLITAGEIKDLKEKMQMLGRRAEECIDIDGLIEISKAARPLSFDDISPAAFGESVKIAVALDEAFCFYYDDSLDMLREMGAEITYFSPLSDKALPDGIQGIYIGGGYPELYLEKLSSNESMKESIRGALKAGMPCIAECGGFMYLTEEIDGYPVVGYIKGKCHNTGKLTRFGYVTLKARRDNMLCRAGEEIRGHEFHYYDCDNNGDSFTAVKQTGRTWECVAADDRLYAGFPHFSFYSNPAFAENFYKTCLEVKHSK